MIACHPVPPLQDRTGFISFNRSLCLLRSLGFNPTDSQVRSAIHDQRHRIPARLVCHRMTFPEFVVVWDAYISNDMVDLDEDLVQMAFEALDLDGRGEIEAEEMAAVLTSLGEHPLTHDEVATFFGLIDENQSGAIDIEEFVLFIIDELLETEALRVRYSQEVVLVRQAVRATLAVLPPP